MEHIKADTIVDASGLLGPLPVLSARKAMDQLDKGQVLVLIATDVSVRSDVSKFTEMLGHEFLHTSEKDGVLEFYIRKR